MTCMQASRELDRVVYVHILQNSNLEFEYLSLSIHCTLRTHTEVYNKINSFSCDCEKASTLYTVHSLALQKCY